MMKSHFSQLFDDLLRLLQPEEEAALEYQAEHSDFVRFNQGRVRQAGQVRQISATLSLYRQNRHADLQLSLSGRPDLDAPRLQEALQSLRPLVDSLQPDPYLQLDSRTWQHESDRTLQTPAMDGIVHDILAESRGLDLVGLHAEGPIWQGFASTWGGFGWHAANSSLFDWSLFHANGQAVKCSLGGQIWNPRAFQLRQQQARMQLEQLGRTARTLQPGTYRAYLAPSAMQELIYLRSFSAQALATGQSPLQKLYAGQVQLSPLISLHERPSSGLSAGFTREGPRQDVPLVLQGRAAERLVSPRSAAEYGLTANGAASSECPLSLHMAGGDLAPEQILQRLDTGLYISNLWYLSHSDLPNARLTGMTRFATFWVENGRIQAPVDSMRFDDSLFSFLGEHLEALTETPELCLDTGTYGRRHPGGMQLPGALVDRLTLTL